jgi:L,D-transpeptidase catalytic domain
MRKVLAAAGAATLLGAGAFTLLDLGSGDKPPRPFTAVGGRSVVSIPGEGHLYARLKRTTVLWSRPGGGVRVGLPARTEFDSVRVLPVVRRRGDWLGVIATQRPNGRLGWISSGDVTLGRQPYSIRIDLSSRQLTLRRHRRVVQRAAVAVGQPSTPTPTGRFAVTDALRVNDAGSPYGCCALALSAHQPKIQQGWGGGDRVAVHATSNESSIGRPVSLGCLRASQYHMRKLIRRVPLGTPVLITN